MSELLQTLAGDNAPTLLQSTPTHELLALNGDFQTFHHDGQLPPDGDWRAWMVIAGRGYGKTRAGAEWVLAQVRRHPGIHVALVGATIAEARAVMVAGDSGIRLLAAEDEIVSSPASGRTLFFANGAMATLYSGANPESLRGPQHHFAWADELAKWRHPKATWDNLQLGLRLGEFPRAVVTTTPKPSALLRRLRAAPDTVETGGPTKANPHLPDSFVTAMKAQYGGTRAGLQELEGRLLDDVEGSLWPVKLIERCRVLRQAQDERSYARTVIGVDPPASAGGTCGIVVCALGQDGCGYVLADCSVSDASPERWARAVAEAAARFDADRVIAEKNQGGDMVRSVLMAASASLPLQLVHAAHGKTARAEPVAALFENGRVFFAGEFAELEAQLGGMVAGGDYEGPSTGSGRSPDRADAMVWALWALLLKPQRRPRISVL
jgi:phage terminase large subunit-like protein